MAQSEMDYMAIWGDKELVWTNPNNYLDAEKVLCDLSKYRYVVVKFTYYASAGYDGFAFAEVGGSTSDFTVGIGYSNQLTWSDVSSARANICTWRAFYAETNGVTFTIGHDNASTTTSTSHCVPKTIWGIK